VNDVARALRMTQPRASKHLRVLREVGLVRVPEAGQQRLYGLDARGLRPIHEWVGGFERFWSESLDRLDEYVRGLQRKEREDGSGSKQPGGPGSRDCRIPDHRGAAAPRVRGLHGRRAPRPLVGPE